MASTLVLTVAFMLVVGTLARPGIDKRRGNHDGSLATVGGGMMKRCGNKLVELLQQTCYAEYGNTNLGDPGHSLRIRSEEVGAKRDDDQEECKDMVECCCRRECSKTYRLTYCDPLSTSANKL